MTPILKALYAKKTYSDQKHNLLEQSPHWPPAALPGSASPSIWLTVGGKKETSALVTCRIRDPCYWTHLCCCELERDVNRVGLFLWFIFCNEEDRKKKDMEAQGNFELLWLWSFFAVWSFCLCCWLVHLSPPFFSPILRIHPHDSLPSPPFLFFHLCKTNVFYVVIKQCQTQKRFINNIKQKVSSNGWGGPCFFAFGYLADVQLPTRL